MKPLFLALMMAVPNVALADMSLDSLVGKWGGEGSYSENKTGSKMRCKLDISGGEKTVTLKGRCASGLGAQQIALKLSRGADGSIMASAAPGAPKNKTGIDVVSGKPKGPHLVMLGTEGEDSVKIELLMNDDGSLRFGVQSIIGPKDTRSVVRLTKS